MTTNIVAMVSSYSVLSVILGIIIFAMHKKVAVFESFLEGASGAIDVTLKLAPYLIAILVAFGMLKDSGTIDLLAAFLGPFMDRINIPRELIPLGLFRPFSGAASNAIMVDLVNEHGPDSLIGLASATIMGSTETSLYVAAVYFGSVGVKRTRHAIPASLIGELAGFLAAVYICQWLL